MSPQTLEIRGDGLANVVERLGARRAFSDTSVKRWNLGNEHPILILLHENTRFHVLFLALEVPASQGYHTASGREGGAQQVRGRSAPFAYGRTRGCRRDRENPFRAREILTPAAFLKNAIALRAASGASWLERLSSTDTRPR